MTVIMVDKMLKIQIIECSSIANWVFSKEMSNELTSFHVWEILNSTVNRMNIQVEKLQNDFNEFEDNYKKSLNNELVSFYIKTCARCFNSFNSLDVIRIESRGYGK